MNKKFLKIFLIVVVSFATLFLISWIFSFTKIKNSSAYTYAVDYIINNDSIIKRIGKIESFGDFPSGRLRKNDTQIETEVTGSKGKVKVYLKLDKNSEGKWEVINSLIRDLQ